MIFKKKYKRTEWMEGLLWAEKTLTYYWEASEHLFVEDTDGLEGYKILGRGRKVDDPHIIKSQVSREYGRGVIDYISHKDNFLT